MFFDLGNFGNCSDLLQALFQCFGNGSCPKS